MVKEKYSEKELRSIYKDAKYNWSKNCEPLLLATNSEVNHEISLWKTYGELHIIYNNDGELKYSDVNIESFHQFSTFYRILVDLLDKAKSREFFISNI